MIRVCISTPPSRVTAHLMDELRRRPMPFRPPALEVFDLYATVGCFDGERCASAI